MKKLVLGVLLTSAVFAARSACTDPPAPKVDWRGCDKRGAQIPDGADLSSVKWTDGIKGCREGSIGTCK